MPLLPPRVIVPLSECSSKVRVQGQITGATVDIFADGVRVGGDTASWSNQLFPLDTGVTLTSGARITATQSLGGETSPQSPQPVEVQAKPPVIGNVGFRSHLYVCGECVWLDGMVPGASVEVKVGGVVRGSGTAHDGQARIGLSQQIGSGEILEAQQTACGDVGPVTQGPLPDSAPMEGRQLPPPKVIAPLKECQRAVTVADVFEGSRVTLTRTSGPNPSACFDARSLWFRVQPLVVNETLTARQEYPKCEIASGESSPVIVESAEPIPIPRVLGPLCEGSTTVTVTDLLPGSKIRILEDGTELGQGEAPEESTFDFPIDPPLNGGTTITAQQELCDNWSNESNGVKVDARPASLPRPVIPGPLFECGSVVRVTNLHPGAGVYVYSQMLDAPIGYQQAYDNEADISVYPQLIVGDNVFAVQIGCGLTSDRSDPMVVQQLSQLDPPNVQPPLDSCMRTIPVINVVPGARVDVYINGVWRGSKDASELSVEVPIYGRLGEEDEVTARQRLCGKVTALSRPVTVLRNTQGYWEGPFNTHVFAVHAALVYKRTSRTAKVLMFSGGAEKKYPLESYLWNPANNRFISQTWNPPGLEDDLFCAHHSFLADGRLLVMGGSIWDEPSPIGTDHAKGIKAAYIFDPQTETWEKVGDMEHGRWYPTAVTLSDGKVLVFSGLDENQDIVPQVEAFDPTSNTWSTLPFSANKPLAIYPSLHLIPLGPHVGQVFYSGTRWAGGSSASTWAASSTARFDPSANLWVDVDDHVHRNRTEGMAVLLPVLLPPAQNARIFVLGGGHDASDEHAETAEIIDLTSANPNWTPTPNMGSKRTNVNAVILPDATIFVFGGHRKFKWSADLNEHVYDSEIYDPNSNSWTPTARMTKPRQYHSVGLLLPDGRVLAAGGVAPPSPHEDQRNMEIYYPPYLCRASRPGISDVPDNIYYDRTFKVDTTQAESIDKVVLIRPSAVTHHTNSEQRYIELNSAPSGVGQLQVTAPSHANLAPPGYYMLFILDSDGTPSVAEFVRLSKPFVLFPFDWWLYIIRFFRRFFGFFRRFFG